MKIIGILLFGLLKMRAFLVGNSTSEKFFNWFYNLKVINV